jgi:hypothetical protein
MEDTHFLSRLRRVSHAEEALALSLYRDPELVRALLGGVPLPEEADRVAIALGDNERGPFVLVTRSGRFVTCLGEGMSIGGLPLITKQKLDSACTRLEELRQRLEAARRLVGPDGVLKLVGRIFSAGQELSREEFLGISAWQPMLAPYFLEQLVETSRNLEQSRPALLKLNPSKPENQERLRTYWNLLWSLGHLAVLAGMGGNQPWMDGAFAGREEQRALFSLPALRHGVTTLALRGSWAIGRLGKVALPLYKRLYAEAHDRLTGFHGAMGLLMLGLGHARLEAEVRKNLASGRAAQPEEPSLQQSGASVMLSILDEREGWLESHRQLGRGMCVRVGRRLPPGSPYRFERPEEVPDELAFPVAANGVGSFISDDPRDTSCMLSLIPWVARAKPEELFLPTDYLRAIHEPWEPGATLALLSPWAPYSRRKPVRVEQRPGRNELCSCGSGKKYKRCCGAAN